MPMIETRKTPRHPCQEAVDCNHWGRVMTVMMRDVSLTGARLRGTDLPQVGSVVRLAPTFGQGQRWVYGRVCWVSRGDVEEAGVEFLEPITRLQKNWVGGLVRENPAERRCATRVNTKIHLEVKLRESGKGLEAHSVDLSRRGARVALHRFVRAGTLADVYMCLPWSMLEVPAQIVRREDTGDHSLRFLGMRRGEEEALDAFLKQELSVGADSSDLSLLKLFNGL